MNHYELLAIISGKFAETELETVTQKIGVLLEKRECTVHYTQNLGRKKLSFPIEHLSYGYYFLVEFDTDADRLAKFDRDLKLDKEIIRHLIVRTEKVGSPKTFEKKETVEVTTTPAVRGSQIPAEFKTLFTSPETEALNESVAPQPTPSVPAPAPEAEVTEPIQEEKVQEEVMQAPAPSPAPSEEKKEEPTPDEEVPASKKKTTKKASYEELDKKLDELLKDDIL